jgi:hypothetical protein
VNRSNLINAGLFQVAWFACVLGGAAGTSWWGAAALLALLAFAWTGPYLKTDLLFAATGGLLGLALDTLWIKTGVLDYHGVSVAPIWIVMLWVGVSLTLNHSLSLFAPRPFLGGVLAGACAPLSYLGGERLGAVLVPDPWMLGYVCAAWFVVFTLAFALAGGWRFSGREATL